MTDADYFTCQFYTWEYRGRGFHVSDVPVHLEPPFIPFVRHKPQASYIDDGKRHTLISQFVEAFKGTPKEPTLDSFKLDYETLEPFVYEEAIPLNAIKVRLPKERRIAPEKMKALLIMLSSYNTSIISFEIIGTDEDIILQFVSNDTMLSLAETYINAYFPEAATSYSNEYIYSIIPNTGYATILDVGLQQEFFRPIQTSKNFSLDPLIGVFAVLDKLQGEQQGTLQILFQSTVNTWTESVIHSATMHDGTSFFINDPSAPKLALEKVRSPLFGVTVRTIGSADDSDNASRIAEQLCAALIVGTKSDSNQLKPLGVDGYESETRITDVYLRQSCRLGMLLNADELVTLVHFPSETIASKKLISTTRKTVATPPIALNKSFVLGTNEHNGTKTIVTCSVEDRIRHTHVIGATGTGKSTLLANLIIQDIEQGFGVVLFDPHGDLVDDIIAHTPAKYLDNIVLIDPSDTEYSIGLNILEAHSEHERELLSSDLVAAFKRHSTSWGDNMSTVLGNAIEVLLQSPKGGTLHDLRRFLIEKEYRQEYLTSIKDPTLLYYWNKEFPLLKGSAIGSIITRLDIFLRPRSIRNMLSQQKGIDIYSMLNEQKVILCKLSQGLLGRENSYLLSSLLLSHIHQAILRRQQTQTRTPVFLYLDEFQNFIIPSVKEMLAGVRKYNVGLLLSHQNMQQVSGADSELLTTVLTNTAIKIAFRVGEPDAKQLHSSFTHFESSDLQNLGKGEAIVAIEQPQFDCSLTTNILPSIDQDEKEDAVEYVTEYCRVMYAKKREEVEKNLYDSLQHDEKQEQRKQDIKPPKENTKPTRENIIVPKAENEEAKQHSSKEDATIKEPSTSAHRYIQMLVKKMAESRGYKALVEETIPGNKGKVDILLSKDNKTIAIEICSTTNAEWECHNINKCVEAKFDTVVSLSEDSKQLEKIKTKYLQASQSHPANVKFFTSDELFAFLDESVQHELPKEHIVKGYRVAVSYDSANDETNKKRTTVAQIILNSLKKQKE